MIHKIVTTTNFIDVCEEFHLLRGQYPQLLHSDVNMLDPRCQLFQNAGLVEIGACYDGEGTGPGEVLRALRVYMFGP